MEKRVKPGLLEGNNNNRANFFPLCMAQNTNAHDLTIDGALLSLITMLKQQCLTTTMKSFEKIESHVKVDESSSFRRTYGYSDLAEDRPG